MFRGRKVVIPLEWLAPACRHDAAVLFAKLNLDGQFHSAEGFVLPDAQIYLPRLSGHEIHRGLLLASSRHHLGD